MKDAKGEKRKSIVVVTISEILATHENAIDTMVFDSMENAEAWVERQIEEKVKDFDLDRDASVDGWFVQIDGWQHTIQYDMKEKTVN